MSKLILTAVGGDLTTTVELDAAGPAELGPDDALVAIEAAPINGADLLFAAGWFGVYPEVPAKLGAEGVGRVVEVGSQVDPRLVGRRVIVLPDFRSGTWATTTVVPVDHLIEVPAGTDAWQLAMLSVNPAAAYALLHDYTELEAGDWVGLNLANSAVAQSLIPLARRSGIRVLAVVRRADTVEQVRRLGADIVLVDGEGLGERAVAALGGDRLKLLFEGTGDPAQVAELVTAVENGGSVVAFAAATGQTPAVPLPDLIYRGVSLQSFYILRWLNDTPRERLEQVYAELAALVEEGVIGADVEASYPLADAATALAHAQQTARNGKVLFVPEQAA